MTLRVGVQHGERCAVLTIRIFIAAIVVGTSAKTESRSWNRYRDASFPWKRVEKSTGAVSGCQTP